MSKFYLTGIIIEILFVSNTSKASAALITFDEQGLVIPSYGAAAGSAKQINVPTTSTG